MQFLVITDGTCSYQFLQNLMLYLRWNFQCILVAIRSCLILYRLLTSCSHSPAICHMAYSAQRGAVYVFSTSVYPVGSQSLFLSNSDDCFSVLFLWNLMLSLAMAQNLKYQQLSSESFPRGFCSSSSAIFDIYCSFNTLLSPLFLSRSLQFLYP